MNEEYRSERKFHNRGDYDPIGDGKAATCDNCGKVIWTKEPVFERWDKYKILDKREAPMLDFPDMVKIYEKTILCRDCVPVDKVATRDWKYVADRK